MARTGLKRKFNRNIEDNYFNYSLVTFKSSAKATNSSPKNTKGIIEPIMVLGRLNMK